MTELARDELDTIRGGSSSSFGRCGPGSDWPWLGDVRTAECLAHDRAVSDHMANGSSYLGAQAKALPHLPAAIGSYLRERLG